jgi:hypothetical protein
MARPGCEGQLKDVEGEKVRLLADLAGKLASESAEGDDGVVHFHEHYDVDGVGRVVFPTGFQHAPGGPQDERPSPHLDDASDALAADPAALLAETAAERRRARDVLRRLEALEEAAQRGAAEPGEGEALIGSDEGGALSGGEARGSSSAAEGAEEFGAGFARGFLDAAAGGDEAEKEEQRRSRGKNERKGTQAVAKKAEASEEFGAGFERGFLDAAAAKAAGAKKGAKQKMRKKTEEGAVEGPADIASLSGRLRSKKRVSFSEPLELDREGDDSRTGANDAAAATAEAAAAAADGGDVDADKIVGGESEAWRVPGDSLLEWVEGASAETDDVLTAERMAYMDRLLGIEDEDADGEGDSDSSASGEDPGAEHGFISKVLGGASEGGKHMLAGPTARAAPEAARKSALATTASRPSAPAPMGPGRFRDAAKAAAGVGADCLEDPGRELAAMPPAEGPSLVDTVVERTRRRRRAPRVAQAPRAHPLPQPAVLRVPGVEADAASRVQRSAIEPTPLNEEELPVDPEPVVSKFMQIRNTARRAA